MATSFPSGLDALTNPTSSDGLNSPDHAGQHANANDAIEALQAKVGINSSAVTSSLDYKITNINASNLASGTVPTARISGSYTGITGVGTLTVGAIPASLLTGTTLPATIVTSSLTSVGTITTGTWSGSFGAVSGANLTTLNASNLSSGTVPSARISGSYTGFTGITVDGASSPAITIGDWSGSAVFSAIQNTNGYLLFGATSGNGNVYLRASGASATVNIGGNASDTLIVGNSDSTFAGTLNGNGVWNNTNDTKASNLWITSYLIANTGVASSGQSAQWLSAFGLWYLVRNSSTRNDKENIQSLNNIVTPSMVDDIDVLLWSRKNAAGIPEIGPMAEDMDAISPFLSTRGIDYDEDGNVVQTEPNGINTNSWLSLLTLGIQDLRKRVAELETA